MGGGYQAPGADGNAVYNLLLNLGIAGVLMFYFGKYAWANPDWVENSKECYIYPNNGGVGGPPMCAPAATPEMEAAGLTGGKDMSGVWGAWFTAGFIFYAIGACIQLFTFAIRFVNDLNTVMNMVQCIMGVNSLNGLFGLAWLIWGCIVRWNANGDAAAMAFESSGKFMKIFLIILLCIAGCMLLCMCFIVAALAGAMSDP